MKNQDKTAQSDLLKQDAENSNDKSVSLNAMSWPEQKGNPSNPGNPGKQPSLPTGGPQFGLGNKGGWGKGLKGWINKYGSSVILPIIALLILAGGIYLYASQKSQEELALPIEEKLAASFEEGIAGLAEELAIQEEIISPAEEETEERAIEEIIPEGRKESGVIIEKAVKGDGVTHLARRALKDYLKDQSQELTNEDKIYIEDYLKDEIGSRPLEIDEEITFSEDLIKEAIDASLQLTPEQLKNLEKYSALVVW
jgi:hypothetical protein